MQFFISFFNRMYSCVESHCRHFVSIAIIEHMEPLNEEWHERQQEEQSKLHSQHDSNHAKGVSKNAIEELTRSNELLGLRIAYMRSKVMSLEQNLYNDVDRPILPYPRYRQHNFLASYQRNEEKIQSFNDSFPVSRTTKLQMYAIESPSQLQRKHEPPLVGTNIVTVSQCQQLSSEQRQLLLSTPNNDGWKRKLRTQQNATTTKDTLVSPVSFVDASNSESLFCLFSRERLYD